MFEHYQLKNKINVLLVPIESTQSVTVLVMFPVGSRYEPEKLNGVSHYIEHMMFKGTKKRKTAQVLTREIDRLGANYNAFTGKEYTGYYIKTDAAYTSVATDILSDMLFNSVFNPVEMEREKGPIIEELRMYHDNPVMQIDTVFESLLFHGSPLGWDIGGTEKHVRSYKRAEVLAFKEKYYCPKNMSLIVAGKINEDTKHYLEYFFGSHDNNIVPSRKFAPYTVGASTKEKRLLIQKKETNQAQVMMGWPGFPFGSQENIVLTVLTTILGGSMSSRLFNEIREKRGLAYSVSSNVESFRDTGYVFVRAGLEAKNINKTIAIVQKEAQKILQKGISSRELEDAKTHIHGATTLSLEDSSTRANWFAKELLFGSRMETPVQWLDKIDTVTNKDIQKIAKRLFKDSQLRIAIIGDVKTSDIEF